MYIRILFFLVYVFLVFSSFSVDKVGLLLRPGGLGDESYNDMLYKGLIDISKEFGVDIAFRSPEGMNYENIYKGFNELADEEKCSIIFCAGSDIFDIILKEELGKYNDRYLVIIGDSNINGKNLVQVEFDEYSGGYIAGILSASLTKTKKIGFIGGGETKIVNNFYSGFKDGVLEIDNTIETNISILSWGKGYFGFNDPFTGYEQAVHLYHIGYDIVFSVAGSSGNGVVQACRIYNGYMIGSYMDQDNLLPGKILTSVIKRLDKVIYDITNDYLNSNLKAYYRYDFSNGGISLSDMNYTREVIGEDIIDMINNKIKTLK